ncbi:Nramp family divalent metal transporter [Candidatus Dependentiae bacterium]|nr:Nramp family divalent metal transporter [Candidatus Dependentiae bacterium]
MKKMVKRKKINLVAKKFAKGLKFFGPGFVTGAADNDPSGIGTYSIAGSAYGLSLLWLCPFLFPLMFVMQEMCARIGLATSSGLTFNMKKVFHPTILYMSIFLLVIANIINIGADIAIMAAATTLVLDLDFKLLSIIITTVIIVMEIFISYHIYSKVLLALAFFLFSYVITAFLTVQNWTEIFQHAFIPTFKFNKEFVLLVTGFFGTTISPYLFFWQTSHEIENKLDKTDHNNSSHHIKKLIRKMRFDTFTGMLFAQIIIFFIVVTCFSSLHVNGITNIVTANDAASALGPLAGQWSSWIFTIGIIGAGFLGVPVIAGSSAYALAEIFEQPEGLSHKFKNAMFFYGIIAFSSLIGLAINFVGINPIKALLYAAVVNAIVSVPIVAFVILLANNKAIMGKHKNNFWSNFLGLATFCTILFCAVLTIYLFLV